MNIHITDIEQYNSLLLATIETVEIGSSRSGSCKYTTTQIPRPSHKC